MISGYFLDQAKRNLDNGPVFVSLDFYRCLTSNNIKNFPSALEEVKFLSRHYGDIFTRMCQEARFAVCGPLDIVWGYTVIDNPMDQYSYLLSKSGILCWLKDMLISLNQWKYYENLPVFSALESLEIFSKILEVEITVPISFTSTGDPITSLQKHLFVNAHSMLSELPNIFGYSGYNFVVDPNIYRKHFVDVCHLSCDPCTLFHYYDGNVLISPSRCVLFDVEDMRSNARSPLIPYQGDLTSLVQATLAPVDLLSFPTAVIIDAVFRYFVKTFPDALYPFVGDKSSLLLSIIDNLRFGSRLSG